jgi:HD-GYP domain-containing protein (c-di-GMP phosphodiesterase class II)
MRLVAVDRLETGARLGRDVLIGSGIPLLRAGVRLSARYIDGLRQAGVTGVYVDDELSAGIDPLSPISDATRRAATTALTSAFELVADEQSGTAVTISDRTVGTLKEVAAQIVQDVLSCGDAAVALQDLATIDAYTLQHSIDVTALGVLLGERHTRVHGWTDWNGERRYDRLEQRLTLLGTGLLLHDIGKLAIPAEVLQKTGELTDDEWQLVREHPAIGYRMLSTGGGLSEVAKSVVRSHHERWDGSGYPAGAVGERIPQLARLAAVADVFDAITAQRAYKTAAPLHVGVQVIAEGAGTLFEPALVATFVSSVAPYPPGLAVMLSDGRRGIVAECPPTAVDRPLVRIVEGGRIVAEVELERVPHLEIVAVDVELHQVAA